MVGLLADRWGHNCMVLTVRPGAIIMMSMLALQPLLVVIISAVLGMFITSTALDVP